MVEITPQPVSQCHSDIIDGVKNDNITKKIFTLIWSPPSSRRLLLPHTLISGLASSLLIRRPAPTRRKKKFREVKRTVFPRWQGRSDVSQVSSRSRLISATFSDRPLEFLNQILNTNTYLPNWGLFQPNSLLQLRFKP